MNDLTRINKDILETQQLITASRREFAEKVAPLSVVLALQSLEQREEKLRAEFEQIVHDQHT